MKQKMEYLDRNEFNYNPAPAVIETVKNFDIKKLCFYTRIYDEGKKSILSVFISEQYEINESQVVLGYGGEDILKQTIHYFLSITDGNKIILVPKFSWWYYKSIADEVNGITIQYPLYEKDNTFVYDIPSLKTMLYECNPKILLMASPNNPTGNALSPNELDEILQFVPSDCIVIIDEAYASFVIQDKTYIKYLIDKYPNLIIIRTLSKFYGLPGLRMGFSFVGKNFTNFTSYINKYLGYNRFAEDVAIAALRSEDYYREVAKNMDEGRTLFTKGIGEIPGFKVYKSLANFILIKFPIELKNELQKELLNQHYKIKFMNEPEIDTHMRITLGRPEQNKFVCDTIIKIARTCKQ